MTNHHFELWYYANFASLGQTDQAHYEGARATWEFLQASLSDVVDGCQPAAYSNEDYAITEAKLTIGAQISSIIGV